MVVELCILTVDISTSLHDFECEHKQYQSYPKRKQPVQCSTNSHSGSLLALLCPTFEERCGGQGQCRSLSRCAAPSFRAGRSRPLCRRVSRAALDRRREPVQSVSEGSMPELESLRRPIPPSWTKPLSLPQGLTSSSGAAAGACPGRREGSAMAPPIITWVAF